MKTSIRYAAAAVFALAGMFTAAACSPGAEEGPKPDDGINVAKATTECELLATFMTSDTEMTPAMAEEMVTLLAAISTDGYPENAKVADIIVASYLHEDEVSQEEANAAVEEWGGFCTRNTAA